MRLGDLACVARHGCEQEILPKVRSTFNLGMSPPQEMTHSPSRSQNQMFSKFNAMGLNNLIQDSLSRGNDITSDIESKLKNAGR